MEKGIIIRYPWKTPKDCSNFIWLKEKCAEQGSCTMIRSKKSLTTFQNESWILFSSLCVSCRFSYSLIQVGLRCKWSPAGREPVPPLASALCPLSRDNRKAYSVAYTNLSLVVSFTSPCSLVICYCLTEVSSKREFSSLRFIFIPTFS